MAGVVVGPPAIEAVTDRSMSSATRAALVISTAALAVWICLAVLGPDGQWTWVLSLQPDSAGQLVVAGDTLDLLHEAWLLADIELILLYVAAAFAWCAWLFAMASIVNAANERVFGAVARRIRRWAVAGLSLSIAAGTADLVEDVLSLYFIREGTGGGAWLQVLVAATWMKWIYLALGLTVYGVAISSAVWRVWFDRVTDEHSDGDEDSDGVADENSVQDPVLQLVAQCTGELVERTDVPLSAVGISQDDVPTLIGKLAKRFGIEKDGLADLGADPTLDDVIRVVQGPAWKLGRQESPAEFRPNTIRRGGICLSGGGIRSASFSLGALQAVQDSELQTPRYVTSVSGGSYMEGAWESLRQGGEPTERIFTSGSAEERWVRHHTDYLVSSFSVVAGAILALVGGMLINLLILLAVTSVVAKPVGWGIGVAHPEMRARTPILAIAQQPEMVVDTVTYSPEAPVAQGDAGPGFIVTLDEATVVFNVANEAKDTPLEVTQRIRFGDAVVANTDDGPKVVRQPSVRFVGLAPGAVHSGDQDISSVRFVVEPEVSLQDAPKELTSVASPLQALEVKRSLQVTHDPEVAQWSGTTGRAPMVIYDWIWFAVAGSVGLVLIAWAIDAPILRTRVGRTHIPTKTLAAATGATLLFLIVLPWFAQEMTSVFEGLPFSQGSGSGSVVTVGVILAAVTAAGKYFSIAGSAASSIGKARGGARILDALVGVVTLVFAAMAATAILNLAIANGPSGILEGWLGRRLPWSAPDIMRWLAWIVALGAFALGPAAHAWSLFTFYLSRLRSAYLLKRGAGGSVAPRPSAEEWSWSGDGDQSVDTEARQRKPEWVVCTTANIRGSGEAAPGRAAGSFTFSRSWVGGPEVGWMRTSTYLRLVSRKKDVDVPSTITISGAAFSPAMGKQSLDWTGRLFAIFNLRLGVWIPTPLVLQRRGTSTGGPTWTPAWPWYLRELVGWYDRTSRFVYLTDGGHWENLGLVELLRRGCTDIWMISAAGDGQSSFETMGQAIALAREELGVEFEIELEPLRSPEKPAPTTRRLLREGTATPTAPAAFVTGTFTYPSPSGARIPGKITVIEATLLGDAAWDVHSYAEHNDDFPDISTGYQLMDHRDFEAYRMLGYTQTTRALAHSGLLSVSGELPARRAI